MERPRLVATHGRLQPIFVCGGLRLREETSSGAATSGFWEDVDLDVARTRRGEAHEFPLLGDPRALVGSPPGAELLEGEVEPGTQVARDERAVGGLDVVLPGRPDLDLSHVRRGARGTTTRSTSPDRASR